MATFVMLGRYSADALKGISKERTRKAEKLISKAGGTVQAMYALLGPYDLVLVVDLPTNEDAMKTSVALTKLTGISFATCPAVTIETFDSLVGKGSSK